MVGEGIQIVKVRACHECTKRDPKEWKDIGETREWYQHRPKGSNSHPRRPNSVICLPSRPLPYHPLALYNNTPQLQYSVVAVGPYAVTLAESQAGFLVSRWRFGESRGTVSGSALEGLELQQHRLVFAVNFVAARSLRREFR